ncbi:MAG: hypothetical protein A2046_15220 [Bacteroidetes bacterium GWA2_30_7]|nr:MAG: hypothetical protein A2046_15220 [Bacteroidetes bacterium GWA2_30_7]
MYIKQKQMNRYLVVVLIFSILLSCKTSLNVTNINNAEKYEAKSLMYYLPETVIKIDVEVTRTVFTKGKFNEFAEKYLNIENAEKTDFVKYQLSDIDIDSYGEPDYNNGFIITGKALTDLKINVTDNFLLAGINNKAENYSESINPTSFLIEKESEKFFFTDLTSKRALNETEDTVYKRIKQDSVFIKVPIIKKQTGIKTSEIKAEDAANLIIKIRKKRLKLLYGEVESKIEEVSIKDMVDGLNSIEKNYLELFIGHTEVDTLNYSFEFTPNNSQELTNNILFYFSEKYGINSTNIKGYEPVTIKILKCGKTNIIESYKAKNTVQNKSNGLFYRIPDCGVVQVFKNTDLVANKKILVAQFGTTAEIPSEILSKKNIKIEINPKLGSLKSIE